MNAPTKTPDPVTPTPSPVPKEEPEFHPLADIFPLLDENGEEFGALVDDIKDNGLRHPIIIYNNKILDGRNRYRACKAAFLKPDYQELSASKDPLDFVISANLHRRHLTETQRAAAAAQVANIKLGGNQHTEGVPIGRASKTFNVGVRSINRARAILANDAIPALKDAVKVGSPLSKCPGRWSRANSSTPTARPAGSTRCSTSLGRAWM